jgi:subfamily B ATP-binding cassette protein MsbA
MDSKKKKISRKEIVELSGRDLWQYAKDTFSRMARYMRPYRGRFLAGVFLGVCAGFFNLVMLMGMQIVLSTVLRGETSALTEQEIPYVGKVNVAGWLGISDNIRLSDGVVLLVCSIIPLLFFVRGMIGYLANYCMMWVGNRILYRLRNDAFKNLLTQSLGYFSKARLGDLIQTVYNQARVAQQNAVVLAQTLTQKPVAILAILLFLFGHPKMKEDWPVLLASLVILPLCVLPVMHIGKRVRKAGAREEQEAGAMMVTMHETFAGIRVVKSYAREDYEVKRFDKANEAMISSIMRWGKALEVVGPVVETVASFGIAAGLFYAYKKDLNAEDFFVIVIALTQIYAPAKDLSRVQIILQKCIVATSTVFAMIEEQPEIRDAPDAKALGRASGAVRFRDVTLTYTDSKGKKQKKPAVNEINLDLAPGKFYALVGPTGAGKTSLFSLLLRLYDADKGVVELDGHDIRTVTQESLRNNIGVVTQETFLFHDTIMENIRYGKLGATDDEVIAAAKKAHVDEFVKKVGGYDAQVGDAGNNLSGGQKQRVSIARAILRNAPVLLLDEATSALDAETEKFIQEAIHELSEGKTVIAIAHRLSTILEADQIIVMNHGRIEAMGTHQELLHSSQIYQRLYHLQYESGTVMGDVPAELVEIETAAAEVA